MDTVWFLSFFLQGILYGFVYKNRIGRIIFVVLVLIAIAVVTFTPEGVASLSNLSYFTHEWYENIIALTALFFGNMVGESTYESIFP